jgi:hypothetical protein
MSLNWSEGKRGGGRHLNVSIGTDLSIVRPPSPLHFGPMSVCVSKTDVHYNHYEFITWWRGLMSFLHPALKSGPFPVVQTRLGRLLPSPPLLLLFHSHNIQYNNSVPGQSVVYIFKLRATLG